MLDSCLDAELVQHPAGVDPDLDRDFHRDRRGRGRCEPHEEPPQVSSGEPERDQRVRRVHGCPQLRAGTLRLLGPRDLTQIRDIRQLSSMPADRRNSDKPARGFGKAFLSPAKIRAAQVGVGSLRDQLEELVGCLRMPSPALGSVERLLHQRFHKQQGLFEEEEGADRRDQWETDHLQYTIRLLRVSISSNFGKQNSFFTFLFFLRAVRAIYKKGIS